MNILENTASSQNTLRVKRKHSVKDTHHKKYKFSNVLILFTVNFIFIHQYFFLAGGAFQLSFLKNKKDVHAMI